jgi:hypothetical protein
MSQFPFKFSPIFAERVSSHFKALAELDPVHMVFELKSKYFDEFEISTDHIMKLDEDNIIEKWSELNFTHEQDFEHGYKSFGYSSWVDISNHELLIVRFEGLDADVRVWLQSDEFETWETMESEDRDNFCITMLPQLLCEKIRVVVFSNSSWKAKVTIYGN